MRSVGAGCMFMAVVGSEKGFSGGEEEEEEEDLGVQEIGGRGGGSGEAVFAGSGFRGT